MPANKLEASRTPDPRPRRKRRSAEEIRALLLEAAAEEFEAHGFARATTAAIARRADVTEAQIFRCFASKAALFRAAIFEPLNAHFISFQARQLAAEGADSLHHDVFRLGAKAYITELQDFIGAHSRMLMSLVVAEAYDRRATGGAAGLEGLGLQGLCDYFARGAAMMYSRMGERAPLAKVQPELMVRVSFAAVLAAALFGDWMFADSPAEPEQLRDAVADFVIDGLNANADAESSDPAAPTHSPHRSPD